MNSFTPVFQEMIELFRTNGITYYITRNSELYPDAFTGDIDIYIDLPRLRRCLPELEQAFVAGNWKIFKKLQRPWLVAYQLINSDPSADRRVMVVELFSGFRWRCFEYLDIESLDRYRVRHNGISVLQREIGYFLAFVHYVLWCGFVPEKYQEEIRAFTRRKNYRDVVSELCPQFSVQLIEFMDRYAGLNNGQWESITDVAEPVYVIDGPRITELRRRLVLQRFKSSPIGALADFAKMFLMRLADALLLPGHLFLLIGGDEKDAESFLFTLKEFHLFKNHAGCTIATSEGLSGLIEAYRVLLRGGAGVIAVSSDQTRPKWLPVFSRRVTEVPCNGDSDFSDINAIVGYVL